MNGNAPSPRDWNRAYERLLQFLGSFGLGDQRRIARLALEIIEEAEGRQIPDGSPDPTVLTQEIARRRLAEWFARTLDREGRPDSEILEAGYLALLLSEIPEKTPQSFLVSPPTEETVRAMQGTLLVTGPDLTVSSMTPRRLDYGPLENLAQKTWQRWDPKEILAAFLLWTAIFFVLYRWLPEWL